MSTSEALYVEENGLATLDIEKLTNSRIILCFGLISRGCRREAEIDKPSKLLYIGKRVLFNRFRYWVSS
jgi:hypothetical protein